jgi:hypothetical protein
VRWVDGEPNARWWPESGWRIVSVRETSDKVEVWFQKGDEKRYSQVEVWSNGRTAVREWRCSGKWGTPEWSCREV